MQKPLSTRLISAIAGVMVLFGASSAAFADSNVQRPRAEPIPERQSPTGVPVRDEMLIDAMAQQQQAIAQLTNVLVQMLTAQQEMTNELRQIRAAQTGVKQ